MYRMLSTRTHTHARGFSRRMHARHPLKSRSQKYSSAKAEAQEPERSEGPTDRESEVLRLLSSLIMEEILLM